MFNKTVFNKFSFLFLVIGFIIGAGVYFFFPVFGFRRAGSIDVIAESNARITDELVRQLGITTEQLPEYIRRIEQNNRELEENNRSVQSDNKRLEEYIRSAGTISKSLAGTITASGANTTSATEISKRLRQGITDLENWFNNIRRDYPGLIDVDIN